MTQTYRACASTWLIFGILSFVLSLGSILSKSLGTLIMGLAIAALLILWVGRFKITITPNTISFRSLFSGENTIENNNIEIVRLCWERNPYRGPLRLFVEQKERKGDSMNINAKVFSRKAIDAVLSLGEQFAKIDDGGLRDGLVMRTVREGNFPKQIKDSFENLNDLSK